MKPWPHWGNARFVDDFPAFFESDGDSSEGVPHAPNDNDKAKTANSEAKIRRINTSLIFANEPNAARPSEFIHMCIRLQQDICWPPRTMQADGSPDWRSTAALYTSLGQSSRDASSGWTLCSKYELYLRAYLYCVLLLDWSRAKRDPRQSHILQSRRAFPTWRERQGRSEGRVRAFERPKLDYCKLAGLCSPSSQTSAFSGRSMPARWHFCMSGVPARALP